MPAARGRNVVSAGRSQRCSGTPPRGVALPRPSPRRGVALPCPSPRRGVALPCPSPRRGVALPCPSPSPSPGRLFAAGVALACGAHAVPVPLAGWRRRPVAFRRPPDRGAAVSLAPSDIAEITQLYATYNLAVDDGDRSE